MILVYIDRTLVKNRLYCGDSFELIKQVEDDSVDLFVTSPPYFAQRSYSSDAREIGKEESIQDYINTLVVLFEECLRATKESGSLVWNIGDKYLEGCLQLVPYRFATKVVENTNAILINNVTWEKQNPTPRQFQRRMVSSTEPFFHFVKSKNYKYYPERLSAKKVEHNPDSNAGQRYFKQIDKSDLSEAEKENAKKSLSEAIEEIKSGKIAGIRMKIRGLHALPFGGQEGGRLTQIMDRGYSIIKLYDREMLRDVITSPVECIKGSKHPAIYPKYIVERFIKLTTDNGDLVLDPFIGSGTTACAAKSLQRNYLGFDINPNFIEEANNRIAMTATSV